jgi:hypothetical protein
MSATNSVVAVYDSHDEAEHAIKSLQQAGDRYEESLNCGHEAHTPMSMSCGLLQRW